MVNQHNPVVYFEIPVTNMKRAVNFYSFVFQFEFESEIVDGYEMALFPFKDSASGITGALAKGDVYLPTQQGVILYFNTSDIDSTLALVIQAGGKILYPKTVNTEYLFAVAEFEDSEGNRIALRQNITVQY